MLIELFNAITASSGYSTLCGGIGGIALTYAVLWLNGRSSFHQMNATLQSENLSLKKEISRLEAKLAANDAKFEANDAEFQKQVAASQEQILELTAKYDSQFSQEAFALRFPMDHEIGLRIHDGRLFCPHCFPTISEVWKNGDFFRCPKCGLNNYPRQTETEVRIANI